MGTTSLEDALAVLESGSVRFHAGRGGRLLTRIASASGITFGRHVFLDPAVVDETTGTICRRLAVHEAVHVVQYQRDGLVRFLARYLADWSGTLWRKRTLTSWARMQAYLDIPYEREARAVECQCAPGRFTLPRAPRAGARKGADSTPAGR